VHDDCCDLGHMCAGNWRDTYYQHFFQCDGSAVCPAGKYIHQSHCYSCPQGQYKEAEAVGCCSACDAGKSTEASGSTLAASCTSCDRICPIGQFGFSSEPSCQACEAGKHKADAGTGCCSSCPSGMNSASGQAVCVTDATCDEGKYAWGEECKGCPAGKFGSSTMGISFCAFCQSGQYQPLAFETGCTDCPGTTSVREGEEARKREQERERSKKERAREKQKSADIQLHTPSYSILFHPTPSYSTPSLFHSFPPSLPPPPLTRTTSVGQYTSFYLGSPYCTACPTGQVSGLQV
jgi:hypothetical protein